MRKMPVAESPRSEEDTVEFASDEEAKRQGRAMLPRLHAVKTEEDESPRIDEDEPAPFNAALELVRAASDALERMRARCREVEAFAQQEIEYHRSQLATADSVIRELDGKTAAQEDSIRQLQSQLDSEYEERQRLQRALEDMRGAFERTQDLLRASESRASAAEAWLGRLHTEIASAFSELPPIGGPSGGPRLK
jgi:chromosome segregation ATPase